MIEWINDSWLDLIPYVCSSSLIIVVEFSRDDTIILSIQLTPPIRILSVDFSVERFLWKLFGGRIASAVLSPLISWYLFGMSRNTRNKIRLVYYQINYYGVKTRRKTKSIVKHTTFCRRRSSLSHLSLLISCRKLSLVRALDSSSKQREQDRLFGVPAEDIDSRPLI